MSHALRHVGTSAITDLIIRLITCVDGPEIRKDILNVSIFAEKMRFSYLLKASFSGKLGYESPLPIKSALMILTVPNCSARALFQCLLWTPHMISRLFLFQWLNEKQLIQSIIRLLDGQYDRDTHDNASRLLIEILRVSRDGQYVPASERVSSDHYPRVCKD